MHHRRNSGGSNSIPAVNSPKRRFQTLPGFFQRVSPDPVFIAGSPCILAGRGGRIPRVDCHRLDPGGTKLHTQIAGTRRSFLFCMVHLIAAPSFIFVKTGKGEKGNDPSSSPLISPEAGLCQCILTTSHPPGEDRQALFSLCGPPRSSRNTGTGRLHCRCTYRKSRGVSRVLPRWP